MLAPFDTFSPSGNGLVNGVRPPSFFLPAESWSPKALQPAELHSVRLPLVGGFTAGEGGGDNAHRWI
jgi:hypothetical protein